MNGGNAAGHFGTQIDAFTGRKRACHGDALIHQPGFGRGGLHNERLRLFGGFGAFLSILPARAAKQDEREGQRCPTLLHTFLRMPSRKMPTMVCTTAARSWGQWDSVVIIRSRP